MTPRKLRILPQLHRAIHQVGLFIASLTDVGVTQAEAVILAYLSDRRRATMSELHRAFGHKRSTLTNVVERLVTRGLVRRDVSGDDRRSLLVSLSRRGSATAKSLHARLAALESAAIKNIPDRDIATFNHVLERLGANHKSR